LQENRPFPQLIAYALGNFLSIFAYVLGKKLSFAAVIERHSGKDILQHRNIATSQHRNIKPI
jgi:hypothetical protein